MAALGFAATRCDDDTPRWPHYSDDLTVPLFGRGCVARHRRGRLRDLCILLVG